MASIYDEFVPRNEHEMCDLFEKMLFLDTDEIMQGEIEEDKRTKKRLVLGDKEKQKLSELGIINRIFRRWFQTSWGWESVSEYFEGETPRYEMARLYPGINRGKDYFSVNLERINSQWKVKPYYYPENFLKENGGVFNYAYAKLKNQDNKNALAEPFFDPEFKNFISYLDFGEKSLVEKNIKNNFENSFLKYWDLFIRMFPGNLVFNFRIRRLSEDEFYDLCFAIKDITISFFASQPSGHKDFLDFDVFHRLLWDTFRKFDNEMFDYKEITEMTSSDKNISRFRKDKILKKSIELHFDLGVLMDRYILFPIERYFNGLEQVWTSKEIFLDDLSKTFLILTGDLKQDDLYINKSDPDFKKYLNAISPYDLKYLWFVPCTVFRLTGDIFKYFH